MSPVVVKVLHTESISWPHAWSNICRLHSILSGWLAGFLIKKEIKVKVLTGIKDLGQSHKKFILGSRLLRKWTLTSLGKRQVYILDLM